MCIVKTTTWPELRKLRISRVLRSSFSAYSAGSNSDRITGQLLLILLPFLARRPPVALDVLKMKSVKWWKLKNNEIIKSYPRSYLRVCLLAHVALLKWRHWGWKPNERAVGRLGGSVWWFLSRFLWGDPMTIPHIRPDTEWAVLILPFTLCHNARSCLMSFHFVFDSELFLFFSSYSGVLLVFSVSFSFWIVLFVFIKLSCCAMRFQVLLYLIIAFWGFSEEYCGRTSAKQNSLFSKWPIIGRDLFFPSIWEG